LETAVNYLQNKYDIFAAP